MNPHFFADQLEFRKWLEKHHLSEKELIVGFYKRNTGKPSMTWSESVDQALCFGWIDSVRRSIDENSYSIRFTPRNKNSIWSAVNIKKIEELTAKGLMFPKGIEAFGYRREDKSKVYSFENTPLELNPELDTIFKANPVAWEYFTKQSASYKKTHIHWIMSAKQEKTRITRLQKLINACQAGQKVSGL